MDQAKATKKGQLVKRGVTVPNDALLDFPNKKKPLKSLYDLHKYKTLVVVSQSKAPNTRAIFPIWSCEVTIEFNPTVISKAELKDTLKLGEIYGSLERRPRYGRYRFAEMK